MIFFSHNKYISPFVMMLIQLFCILASLITIFAIIFYYLSDIPDNGIEPDLRGFHESIYFSVVTISSLGYGDYQPVGYSRVFASIEVLVGLGFIGYFVSRVVSFRHAELLERLHHSDVIEKFDQCLRAVREEKESLADLRRKVRLMNESDSRRFQLGKGNPLYGSKRALEGLLGYIEYIQQENELELFGDRMERAAHHVEELASVLRRFLNVLNQHNVDWKTKYSSWHIREITNKLTRSIHLIGNNSVYAEKPYKHHVKYGELLESIIISINDYSRK